MRFFDLTKEKKKLHYDPLDYYQGPWRFLHFVGSGTVPGYNIFETEDQAISALEGWINDIKARGVKTVVHPDTGKFLYDIVDYKFSIAVPCRGE